MSWLPGIAVAGTRPRAEQNMPPWCAPGTVSARWTCPRAVPPSSSSCCAPYAAAALSKRRALGAGPCRSGGDKGSGSTPCHWPRWLGSPWVRCEPVAWPGPAEPGRREQHGGDTLKVGGWLGMHGTATMGTAAGSCRLSWARGQIQVQAEALPLAPGLWGLCRE